jgi:uncharacterized protein
VSSSLGRAGAWCLVAVALVIAARLIGLAGLPTPYLFAAFVVGIAFALGTRRVLLVPLWVSTCAQGVIGVTAGSYLTRSTLSAVAGHAVPILGACVLTVVLSIASGLLLTRLADVDPATAAFGMIAGGAAGIVSISRGLGADERLVAVMQYIRLLIIVAAAPLIAIGIFGMTKRSAGRLAPATFDVRGLAFVVAVVAIGLAVAIRLRIPAGAILVPMILAACLSLVHHSLVQPVPVAVGDLAFAAIGLDVGLRFTPATIREAGAVLAPAIAVIVAMLVVCAGIGVALAETVHVTMLDAYLATTPGGLSAVLALALGGKTNATFIVSVQVIRTFLMLAAAPSLARWFADRHDAVRGRASTDESRAVS